MSAHPHPANECGDPSDCPGHAGQYWSHAAGYPHEWCENCGHPSAVDEVFEDQIGFEEQARPVRVTRLDCGHEIVVPSRWESR